MVAVWLGPGKQTFVDANGKPLVAGLVDHFIPGTDTRKDTWQDPQQLALNTNPVVLDARGQASIFGSGYYRQRLTDADGNEIWDRVCGYEEPATQNTYAVANIAALRALTDAVRGDAALVYVKGYYDVGDGGEGWFALDAGSGAVDNGGTVIEDAQSNPWLRETANVLSLKWFGAYGTGLADDTDAVLRWAAQLGVTYSGLVPGGVYNLASATLGAAGIAVTEGMTIEGRGGAKFNVTGASSCNLFTGYDISNVTITGLTLRSNNQASGFGVGYGFSIGLTAGATADISGFRLKDCRFENFKGDYWTSFVNESPTYVMRDIWADANDFYSFAGNTRGPTNLGILSGNVLINADAGPILNVWITNNYSDAKWIKSFCLIFSYAADVHVTGNTIDNAGVGEAQPDKGAYAILIYGSTSTPNRITVADNIINAPFSCGIYAPQAAYLSITGNTISGQADTADGTLPKGAIVVAGVYNVVIADNICYGNFCDAVVEGPLGGGEAAMKISGLQSAGCTGGRSIRVLPAIGGPAWAGLTINDCNIKTAGKGISFEFSNVQQITDVVIATNRIEATYCIDLNASNVAGVGVAKVKIAANQLKGSSYGVYAYDTNGVSITDNQFDGQAAGAHIYGETALSVFIQNNTFDGQAAGNTMILPGAQGGMWGNNFWNCATPVAAGATELGYQIPTWAGYNGLMVQCLVPGSLGGAGTTYSVLGWICTGGMNWVEWRVPDQTNVATM